MWRTTVHRINSKGFLGDPLRRHAIRHLSEASEFPASADVVIIGRFVIDGALDEDG